MKQDTLSLVERFRPRILAEWADRQSEGFRSDELLSASELKEHSSQLLSTLTLNVSMNDRTDEIDESLETLVFDWSKRGITAIESMKFIFHLKDTLSVLLRENITDEQVLSAELRSLDKFLDDLAVSILEKFIHRREREILRQVREISDIRMPIIELWKNILTLPIIGTLDSSRTMEVMEEVLQRIARDNVAIFIIDISGVPTIDSGVAQHLQQLVSAVRLLGADCIISGMRPEIAQTIVHLGIEMTGITTKATLANALSIAFQRTDLQVSAKEKVRQ